LQTTDEIKEVVLRSRMEFIPVLDQNGILENVIFWDDLFIESHYAIEKTINAPVVIMAGGFGSRLRPLTNILPKPLIPIGEKTILETIMDKFIRISCNNFYLTVNYKADFIKYYLTQLESPNYNINYIQEDKPLGTAGSLSLLKKDIMETFFVSNCDILIEQNLSEIWDFHKENKNEITITAALKTYSIPYGTLETGENGQLINLIEKPDLTFKINSGLYKWKNWRIPCFRKIMGGHW
jgi:NDP-sugar pyrophosphorylase family protein